MGVVTDVTDFSRSGLYSWMAQRVSAVVPTAYVIFLLGYLITRPNISYMDRHDLFSQGWVCISSLLTLTILSVYVWIGMQTISTNHLTSVALGKATTVVRFLFQAICGMTTFALFIWGMQILQGM